MSDSNPSTDILSSPMPELIRLDNGTEFDADMALIDLPKRVDPNRPRSTTPDIPDALETAEIALYLMTKRDGQDFWGPPTDFSVITSSLNPVIEEDEEEVNLSRGNKRRRDAGERENNEDERRQKQPRTSVHSYRTRSKGVMKEIFVNGQLVLPQGA